MISGPPVQRFHLRFSSGIFAILCCLIGLTSAFGADSAAPLRVTQVQGRVYMISGAGGNVTVQVGDEGVVVVDPGMASMSDKVLAAIQTLSTKPIIFVIDTAMDEDHAGANGAVASTGAKLSGADNNKVTANAGQVSDGASIVAHIAVLNRMLDSGKKGPAANANMPTDTYDGNDWSLFNEEPVILYHAPAAHTDGDTYVLFRRSDVVVTGELFEPTRYPIIDIEKGGSIDGIINALTSIIDDVVKPGANEEGGTYIIPGRGRICDRSDIVNYRDMLAIVRASIADLIKKGKTLQEIKNLKPTLGYDGLYGADTGPWTTNMFVEAVYRNLTKDTKHK